MDLAIKSLKFQAADFVTKPINDEVLEMTLARVSEKIAMRAELRRHTENLERLVEEKSQRIVQLERQAAVGQVVESLSGAIRDIAGDIEDSAATLSDLPCFISIHNQYMEVVSANALYRARLGEMTGRGSWEVYAGVEPRDCPVGRTFRSGAAQRMEMTVRTTQGERVPVLVQYRAHPWRRRRGGTRPGNHRRPDDHQPPAGGAARHPGQVPASFRRGRPASSPCRTASSASPPPTGCSRSTSAPRATACAAITVYAHRDAPCDKCPVARTFETGQSHQWETVVTSRAGKPYNVLLWTAPIRDASGAITEVMEMATDITQLRELQDHLASLGLMIGSMSHGIKGMLTALDGGVYRVESGFRNGDDQRVQSGWGTVKDMVSRIRSMVLQMLHYAKHRELTGPPRTWGPSSRACPAGGAKARKAAWPSCAAAPRLGSFEADAPCSARPCSTCWKTPWTPAWTTRPAPAQRDLRRARRRTGLTFTVADDGTGIDRETRERMFTLFFIVQGLQGHGPGPVRFRQDHPPARRVHQRDSDPAGARPSPSACRACCPTPPRPAPRRLSRPAASEPSQKKTRPLAGAPFCIRRPGAGRRPVSPACPGTWADAVQYILCPVSTKPGPWPAPPGAARYARPPPPAWRRSARRG
jgi:PAS domain-containing protein